MDPNIDTLPFFLQHNIMAYRPRLPYLPNKKIILKHLNIRYCKRCGEYIDIFFHPHNKPPVHCHGGRQKYNKPFRYGCFYPYLILNMKQVLNEVISVSLFENVIDIDIELFDKLVYRIKGNRYFYNMTKVLRKKSFNMTRMMTIPNIFSETEIYTVPEFCSKNKQYSETLLYNTSTLYTDFIEYTAYRSPAHYNNIYKILKEILFRNPSFIYSYKNEFIKNIHLLELIIKDCPKTVMEMLYEDPMVPDDVFKRIIQVDYALLEYIPITQLSLLYSRNSEWFHDLYNRNLPDIKEYIYFDKYDPLTDTNTLVTSF